MPAQLCFGYEPIGTVFYARIAQSGQIMSGQDDHSKLRVMLVKFQSSFKTVHLRHLKIHQHHLGVPPSYSGECLFPILRRGHDFKDWVAFKKRTKRS